MNNGKILECQPGTTEVNSANPKKKPIRAKGMAKMVCENLTKER